MRARVWKSLGLWFVACGIKAGSRLCDSLDYFPTWHSAFRYATTGQR
jgi:hypothetical protein